MREDSLDCVQKLRRDELDSALEVLHMMFDQSEPLPTSTAAWSAAAAAAGHHIGHLYGALGGHRGRGELAINFKMHQHGIFSLP